MHRPLVSRDSTVFCGFPTVSWLHVATVAFCAWIIVDSAEVVRVVRTVPKANQRPRQQLLLPWGLIDHGWFTDDHCWLVTRLQPFSRSNYFLNQLCSSRQLRKANSPVLGDRFGPETHVSEPPSEFLRSQMFFAFIGLQNTDLMSYCNILGHHVLFEPSIEIHSERNRNSSVDMAKKLPVVRPPAEFLRPPRRAWKND